MNDRLVMIAGLLGLGGTSACFDPPQPMDTEPGTTGDSGQTGMSSPSTGDDTGVDDTLGSDSGEDTVSDTTTTGPSTCADVTCDPNATCDDGSGQAICTCNEGFAGDGTTCDDVDECAEFPCDPNAACMNLPGTFECTCNNGFAGDGFTCATVDECATGMNDCAADQLCINEVMGFRCACPPGLTGTPCQRGTILVYDDTSDDFHAQLAAMSLGYTVNLITNQAEFNTAFDAGGFDLVVYDSAAFGLDANAETRLMGWISGGGRLVFNAYNLNNFPMMQGSLGVTAFSYNSARPVHLAASAVMNVFMQYDGIDTPLTTTRDAGDNGDELTLAGPGVVLASLDSPMGPAAMVLTNGHRVLVNGFLPYDIGTTDGEGDGTPDMVEMYRNQINLVMNPRVLSYNQAGTTGPQTTARRIQWTGIASTTGPGFTAAYDAGLHDVVVIDAPTQALPPGVIDRVASGIAAGDRVVFSWWDLESNAPLQAALGVNATAFDTPRDVYDDPGGLVDFFHVFQLVPDPLVPMLDAPGNGHTCALTGAGTVAARFDDAMGPGSICVTNGGRVIVNGFLPYDIADSDLDGDMVRDIEELYENQLYWLLTP